MKRIGAPASGIVYAVLVVVGLFLLVIAQIDGKTDQEILSHYADGGNRTGETIGFILVVVGVLFFLWFASELRSRLRAAESDPGTLSTLAFGAAVAGGALLVGAAAFFGGMSLAVDISSNFEVDPDLARFAVVGGYGFLIGSVLVNLVLVAATSVLALRTTVLPNWLGWAGFAAVVLAVVEVFLLPVFVVPVWVLVVSVVLTMRMEAG